MESSMTTAELTTLIALAGLVVTVLALVGGVFYRLGGLNNRANELDRGLDRLAEENLRAREEFRQEFRELREENRRNHQQLLQALAHHTHDPDTGFAIFRIPPGMENPAG